MSNSELTIMHRFSKRSSLFRQCNAIDRAIYRHYRELSERRFAATGLDDAAVSAFKQRNARFAELDEQRCVADPKEQVV